VRPPLSQITRLRVCHTKKAFYPPPPIILNPFSAVVKLVKTGVRSNLLIVNTAISEALQSFYNYRSKRHSREECDPSIVFKIDYAGTLKARDTASIQFLSCTASHAGVKFFDAKQAIPPLKYRLAETQQI
jgi:hypothetical protein